jgi:ATP synthase protein I
MKIGHPMSLIGRNPVYRIVIAQLLVTLLLALVGLVIDWVYAYSMALGGLVSALPSSFMAWRLNRQEINPALAFKTMVVGEVGKLVLTALMFADVFGWVKPLNIPVFFAALVLAMMLNVIVPLVDRQPHNQQT